MVKSTVMIVTLLLLVVIGLLVPVPLRGPQAAPLADLAHAPVFAAVELLILLVWWFPLVKHCGSENARPQPIWASICSRVLPVFALLFLFGVAWNTSKRMSDVVDPGATCYGTHSGLWQVSVFWWLSLLITVRRVDGKRFRS